MNAPRMEVTRSSFIPAGIRNLRGYRRAWLRPDLLAGITVLAYLVPQVLAYSGLIGLPPEAGLVTAMVAVIAYAILGSSKIISVGPESTVALMTGLLVAPLATDGTNATSLIAVLTMMVAGWTLLAWLLRLGAISTILSKPILVGYLTGTATLMAVSQLGKATRTSSSGETVIDQFRDFLTTMPDMHLPSLAVAGATLLALFVLPKLTRKIPAALTVITLATVATWLLGLTDVGVEVLGDMPRGLPELALPSLDRETLHTLLFGSLGVALVAYSDVMLTARAFTGDKDRINPNSELLALSGVHAASSIFGGYPSSASSSRTAIAKVAGAKSQAYGLVIAAGIAAVLLFAGPLFHYLPKPALAAIVVWAATQLISVSEYRAMWRFRRSEFALAAATAVGTCALGILPGIGIAVGLSIMDMLMRLARPHDAVEALVPGLPGLHNVTDYPNAQTIPGLLIYRYDAPLFFANAENFRDKLEDSIAQELAKGTGLDWIVINVEANMHVDYTATETLRAIIERTHAKGRKIGFARMKNDIRDQLQAAGLIDLVGEDMVFPTLPAAIIAYEAEHPKADVPDLPDAGQPFTHD